MPLFIKTGRLKNIDESEDLPNSILKLSGKQKRIKKQDASMMLFFVSPLYLL